MRLRYWARQWILVSIVVGTALLGACSSNKGTPIGNPQGAPVQSRFFLSGFEATAGFHTNWCIHRLTLRGAGNFTKVIQVRTRFRLEEEGLQIATLDENLPKINYLKLVLKPLCEKDSIDNVDINQGGSIEVEGDEGRDTGFNNSALIPSVQVVNGEMEPTVESYNSIHGHFYAYETSVSGKLLYRDGHDFTLDVSGDVSDQSGWPTIEKLQGAHIPGLVPIAFPPLEAGENKLVLHPPGP